jgi:acetyl-CoA synthetase
MDWPPISKSPANLPVQPNLVDYDKARAGFSWEALRKELGGLPDGGLNIAHEAVDRHVAGPRRDHLALRWLGADGATRDFTYRDLAEGSSRFANVLRELGAGRGHRVFALAGRIPELYISALGTLKKHERLLPTLLGIRPRADLSAAAPGRREGFGDDRAALQKESGRAARAAATVAARAFGRCG